MRPRIAPSLASFLDAVRIPSDRQREKVAAWRREGLANLIRESGGARSLDEAGIARMIERLSREEMLEQPPLVSTTGLAESTLRYDYTRNALLAVRSIQTELDVIAAFTSYWLGNSFGFDMQPILQDHGPFYARALAMMVSGYFGQQENEVVANAREAGVYVANCFVRSERAAFQRVSFESDRIEQRNVLSRIVALDQYTPEALGQTRYD
jgi:hypothetical protein